MITRHACLLSWAEAKQQATRMGEIPPFQQPQMGHQHLTKKT